jgi:hypothetical protein
MLSPNLDGGVSALQHIVNILPRIDVEGKNVWRPYM